MYYIGDTFADIYKYRWEEFEEISDTIEIQIDEKSYDKLNEEFFLFFAVDPYFDNKRIFIKFENPDSLSNTNDSINDLIKRIQSSGYFNTYTISEKFMFMKKKDSSESLKKFFEADLSDLYLTFIKWFNNRSTRSEYWTDPTNVIVDELGFHLGIGHNTLGIDSELFKKEIQPIVCILSMILLLEFKHGEIWGLPFDNRWHLHNWLNCFHMLVMSESQIFPRGALDSEDDIVIVHFA